MSDLIAPTIGLNRKPDTGDNVKVKAGPKYDVNIASVPNYSAGWLAAGGAAFNLADHIDQSIKTSRADADYNDFRIKMDQLTTDFITANKSGYTTEELRTKVFDEMNRYAQDNMLSKEYMDDPRIKKRILDQFDGYVVNISNTIYGDNAKKVYDTQVKEASSSYMMALNDAATAHNTKDGAKYEAIAKQKHDEMLRVGGVNPNSEQGKAAWMQQRSKLLLSNTLQDLADPGWNPWKLRTKIMGMKGEMMIDDYTQAMNAINAAIDRLSVKSESERQMNLDNFMMSIGHGDERAVFAAAMNVANEMMADVAKNGDKSPYFGMTKDEMQQKSLTIARAGQLERRKAFDAETSYMVNTQAKANDFLMSLDDATRTRVVEYMNSGQATDEDVVLLSHNILPFPNEYPPNLAAEARNELLINKFVATEGGENSKAFDSFSNIKRNFTMNGIMSTPFDQHQTEANMIAGTPNVELITAFRNAQSIEDFGRQLGIKDQAIINDTYVKARKLSEEDNTNLDEMKLYSITDNLVDKYKSNTLKVSNASKSEDKVLRGATYNAVKADFIEMKKTNPSLTIADYYQHILSTGYTKVYVDKIKSSPYLTKILKK